MNNSFLEDFKNAWGKPNNALAQIILINVIVFVAIAIINVITTLSGTEFIHSFVYNQFSIPPIFSDFITRPWTILTYAFNHNRFDIFHILFNMLILNWFGRLIVEYLGNQKVISLYVLGALAGAVVYLVVYNTIPFYIERAGFSGMVGASAAVYAVTVAAATLMPEFKFHLLFFGPVKIKYIAAFYILLSFIGSVGGNAGGNIAHLGGAAIGYFYIRQLQSGNDIGKWVISSMSFFKSFFVKQSKIKVTHKTTKQSSYSSTSSTSPKATSSHSVSDQDEIDAILDKISKSGYESLSKSEKQKLFNASKN